LILKIELETIVDLITAIVYYLKIKQINSKYQVIKAYLCKNFRFENVGFYLLIPLSLLVHHYSPF